MAHPWISKSRGGQPTQYFRDRRFHDTIRLKVFDRGTAFSYTPLGIVLSPLWMASALSELVKVSKAEPKRLPVWRPEFIQYAT